MQIVHADGNDPRELEVSVERPDATLADLAAALGVSGPLSIDGRIVRGDLGIHESGLVNGSSVARAGTPSRPQPDGTVAVLRVVGGLAAGWSVPLAPGETVIGRRPGPAEIAIDDPAVSRRHARLSVGHPGQVTINDLGSRNGTAVGGVLLRDSAVLGPVDVVSLGGTVLLRVIPALDVERALPVDTLREARPGGTVPFTRAPRPVRREVEEVVPLPTKPGRRDGATFNLSMLAGPVVMAVAMVVISKDIRYAAISVLSPLMMLANVIEDRTRGRFSVRRGVREFGEQVEALRRTLVRRALTATARLWEEFPDLAEITSRATGPSARLWERRPGSTDFLKLSAGVGKVAWIPPVRSENGTEIADEVAGVLREVSSPRPVPIEVDLSGGGVVGIQGDRAASLALARSLLCQAAVTAGPADVVVAVCADADRTADWDWAKWLPHTADRRGGGSARLLAAGAEDVDELARSLLKAEDAPTTLLVVDGATLLEGRPCPLRELLAGRGGPVAGIVITERLPALCTVTATVAPDGTMVLNRLQMAERVPDVLVSGLPEPLARRCARALARFEDPELTVQGAGLPGSVTLLPLLGMAEVSGRELVACWRRGAASRRAQAVLGVTEDDVFRIDLDDDGPHGLIAGTTGSGKSELLRTLVASLAADNDPEHLTFALVDYKGGGALDECAKLPHAVGLVTDLDEQLGARALRCLRAELRRRERMLREVGLSHVRDYQRLRDGERPDLEPMPRLAVVIDEFATLVKALPDFVDDLVGIAQLGRSLGMHMIMATQRPAGSVSEAIKNNVKLRIALRLESTGDSQDVIDSPVAASIGGRQWGRAFYRVSATETLPVQTALSTGVTAGGSASPISVRPFAFETPDAATAPQSSGPAGPTDLTRLVTAAGDAFAACGMAPPRQPWPPPLPAMVPSADLPAVAERGLQSDTSGLPALALADDPDQQTQYPVGWDPAAGNLLLYGIGGSGTSTALTMLALSMARLAAPDDLHLYVLDLGAGRLAPLDGLPHTGAHVGAAEKERQRRLVRLLRTELDTRKASGGLRPRWVVLIDNLGAFLAEHGKDAAGMGLIDDLHRVYADGPAVGIHVAATADRSGAIPGPWASITQQKLLFRLADAADYGTFSVPRAAVPSFVPGRSVVAATAQVVQVAWPGDDLATAVKEVAARWPGAARSARRVGVLPGRVLFTELRVAGRTVGEARWLPVGIADSTLEPAGLTLYDGEHALIAGPARSGRSTALCTIACAALAASDPPTVVAYAPRRSPLRALRGLAACVTTDDGLRDALAEPSGRRLLVLVDDADTLDDIGGAITGLLESSGVHVVTAGRADAIRRAFGHWTQTIRQSRCGILLVPDYDLDGELLGATLPRQDRMAAVAGRGYLISDGTLDGIQVALPDQRFDGALTPET